MNNKAFVLLETIVVTGVLGILLVMMYPAFINLINLSNEYSNYNNVEYLYRTKVYANNYLNDELGSSDIKVLCEGENCTNESQKFLNIKAAYLVNSSKIDSSLLTNNTIYITTRRYLKYITDNKEVSGTLLVIAYKDGDEKNDLYSYSYINLNNLTKTTKETFADHIENMVKDKENNNVDKIELNPPSDNSCTNTFRYDHAGVDNNLRYIGKNPCNYIKFNNETWRIIGVMHNVKNDKRISETRVKIIREKSLGMYSWDTTGTDRGTSGWNEADLMYELNGDYLNANLRKNTYWYDDENDNRKSVFEYKNVLNATSQSLIEKAEYYLGANRYTSSEYPAEDVYSGERSLYTWETANEYCRPDDKSCPRKTSWVGTVALPYVSDYIYAGECGAVSYYVGLLTNLSCTKTNYLDPNDAANTYHTLNVSSDYWSWQKVIIVLKQGTAGTDEEIYACGNRPVRPVVYLKANVLYSKGSGTPNDPYEVKL